MPTAQTPQINVTGPAHIFVSAWAHGQNADPLYLGTAERRPRISIRPQFTPVYRDVSGGVAADQLYDGEDGIVIADLNRLNLGVYYAMLQRVSGNLINSGKAAGTLAAQPTPNVSNPAIGTMMVAEGAARMLWIQFPNEAKQSADGFTAFPNMPKGFRFHAAYLMGPDDLDVGSAPKRVRCVWHCLRKYTISESTDEQVSEDQILYDHDMSGLPDVNIPK